MWRVALMSLVVGCANTRPMEPRVFCVTECDMFIAAQNNAPIFKCEDYREAEALLRTRLNLPLCQKQPGVTVWEMPGFETPIGGIRAAGWSDCWVGQAFIHTGDGFVFTDRDPRFLRQGPEDTAFVHELVHIAQGCVAPVERSDPKNPGHENWDAEGYYTLIDHINGELRGRRNEGK